MYILRCSSAFKGRAPTRPNTPIWLPDSSTARSRSTPLEMALALAPKGSLKLAISRGVGRGLKPAFPGVSGDVSCTTRRPFCAIGKIGEFTRVRDAQLHVVQVIDAAARIEDLVNPGLGRALDIKDDQALRAGRDIGVSSREINAASIRDRQYRNRLRSCQIGDI